MGVTIRTDAIVFLEVHLLTAAAVKIVGINCKKPLEEKSIMKNTTPHTTRHDVENFYPKNQENKKL
jgi:hypothetical protein